MKDAYRETEKILSKILVNYAGINSNDLAEDDLIKIGKNWKYYNGEVFKYKDRLRAVLTSNNYFYITNILKKDRR